VRVKVLEDATGSIFDAADMTPIVISAARVPGDKKINGRSVHLSGDAHRCQLVHAGNSWWVVLQIWRDLDNTLREPHPVAVSLDRLAHLMWHAADRTLCGETGRVAFDVATLTTETARIREHLSVALDMLNDSANVCGLRSNATECATPPTAGETALAAMVLDLLHAMTTAAQQIASASKLLATDPTQTPGRAE